MRYLVLGGGGFIGAHLVDALCAKNSTVVSFDKPSRAVDLSSRPNVIHMAGDFANDNDLRLALQECDICFHLISTTIPSSSNVNPIFDIESNVAATIRLLELAVAAGVKKIVYASSGGTVYGVPKEVPIPESHPTEPICSYGIAKLAVEKYFALFHRLYGLEYTALRMANSFGERQRTNGSQGAVGVFLRKLLREEIIDVWGDGSAVRDYIHVFDVVSALFAAAERNAAERIFNIGSGRGLSVLDVIKLLESVTGRTAKVRHLRERSIDVPINVLRIDRANELLGWKPRISFEDGIKQFACWLENHLSLELA